MPPLFYVMGPSGAGKDSVLRFARAALQPNDRIVFAHRYITRPPDPSENFIALSDMEFAARRGTGAFAFSWQAHGLWYGIGREIELWRKAGNAVVLNGSREHFLGLADTADLSPVLITADVVEIARRLRARGREPSDSIDAREGRAFDLKRLGPSLTVIDNSGPIEEAGDRFMSVIRSQRVSTAAV
jgi:ribose 1,5-bisphosphokinase